MTAGLDEDQLGQLVEALDDLTITLDEENQG